MGTGVADLLGVLQPAKLALNDGFFVRREYALHPKSGNVQEVPRASVDTYTPVLLNFPIKYGPDRTFSYVLEPSRGAITASQLG